MRIVRPIDGFDIKLLEQVASQFKARRLLSSAHARQIDDTLLRLCSTGHREGEPLEHRGPTHRFIKIAGDPRFGVSPMRLIYQVMPHHIIIENVGWIEAA